MPQFHMNYLDKAIIPSGLIRSAKTYTLLRDKKGMYIIKVGPAGNKVNARGPINQFAVNKVYEAIARKVDAGEKRLGEMGPEALLQEKGNAFLQERDIIEVLLNKDIYNRPKLSVITRGKKYAFHFDTHTEEEIREFMKGLL